MTICEHCRRPIELKEFRPSRLAAMYQWWSHVGGSSYCLPKQASPAPPSTDQEIK